jgi:hypothetical protein
MQRRVSASERRRLDAALRPSRTLVERAAAAMVLHAKASTSDTVPRPPFLEVTICLHEAVAILAACDDKLSRADVVELIIEEFLARLRLKVEGLLQPEGIHELLESTRATLNSALRLQ